MRVSVAVAQGLGVDLAATARYAEDLGFAAVHCFDHLVPLGDPTAPAVEAAVALGTVAAATRRVEVGALVLRATLRPPAVTAAIADTLAAIAPGRVSIGLGIGDRASAREMARFGFAYPPLRERVATLAATAGLVAGRGHPVRIGGTHPAVVEVAATIGAHNLWEVDPDDVGALAAPGAVRSWGGRVAPFGARPDVLGDGGAGIAALLERLADAGVDEAVLVPLPAGDATAMAAVADHITTG